MRRAFHFAWVSKPLVATAINAAGRAVKRGVSLGWTSMLFGALSSAGVSIAQPSVFHTSNDAFGDRSPTASELYSWEPAEAAFYIASKGDDRCCWWSPDGTRLLLILHYGTVSHHGEPMPVLRTDLSFLNYNRARTRATALLMVELEERTITPLRLPFELERMPGAIGWWNDDALLLVGTVQDGLLANQWRTELVELTVVELGDMSHRTVPIPREITDTHDCIVDYAASVVRAGDVLAVSCWLPQVAGGGEGVFLFSTTGPLRRFTRDLIASDLRFATEANGRLAGSGWSFDLASGRRSESAQPEPRAHVEAIGRSVRAENGLRRYVRSRHEAYLRID